MSTPILEFVGLLFMYWIIILLILTVLELSTFQKKIKKFNDKSTVVTNMFKIQAHDSVMCGYFCSGFIDFILKDKNLTDLIYLFSPNNFKNNDDINYFKNSYW